MRKLLIICLIAAMAVVFAGCNLEETSETKDAKSVSKQQGQYAKGQPVPVFDWSLERDKVIKLYQLRNKKVSTHSVWRSDLGTVEGDCPSYGYGIPFDTSLTNPVMATDEDSEGYEHAGTLATLEQAEPNGLFASKNTMATWVMCLGEGGQLEPMYIETKVTVYPGPVKVDYDKNRVTRSGAATVLIRKD